MRLAFAALYVIFDPRKWLPHRSNGEQQWRKMYFVTGSESFIKGARAPAANV
jgi:hypothetical protein